MFRYLVLGLLRNRLPRHGYALMKDYEARSAMRISSGTFYRELQRLATEGLVRVVDTSPGVDRRRAPYEITDDGIAALEGWLTRPTGNVTGAHHDELFARIVLLGYADAASMRRGLGYWREELHLLASKLARSLESDGAEKFECVGAEQARALMLVRRLEHVRVDLRFIDQLLALCDDRKAFAAAASPPSDRTEGPPGTERRAADRRALWHRTGGRRERTRTVPPRPAASASLSGRTLPP